MAYKDYRDPIYGFIGLNEQEQKIVDSRAFQRLRYIRQLGTTYLVYPTGNHTRFEHSLGTLEAATRLFESITGRPEAPEVLGWTPRDAAYYRQLLRYAALLHDLGQPPFSHASEALLPRGRDHEDYTYAIVTGPELGNEERKGPELAVEDGGLHTVEGLLLARYFMFLDVYFHKTRRILDLHLTELLSDVLPGGRYPEDVGEFLEWDDVKALSRLVGRERAMPFLRLFGRAHFRLVFETSDHPDRGEVVEFDWLCAELEREYGGEVLRFDEAERAAYNYARPPLSVWWRGKYVPIEKRSPLVRSLRRIRKMRVYAAPELRDEASRFCEQFVRARGKRREG